MKRLVVFLLGLALMTPLLAGVANGPVILGAFLCWSVLGIHYLLTTEKTK